jgi:hypothetical protein
MTAPTRAIYYLDDRAQFSTQITWDLNPASGSDMTHHDRNNY